jgi:TRAP-type C4-dicarboxylate transport system substrate-binding protein
MKHLRVLRFALLAALFAAGSAFAQMELKFGHVGNPGSLFQKSADEFAQRANAKLGGKAKVVVFGSSQLGNDRELLQKLKLGTVDFALPSTVMSSEADVFGMFEMPYLVKDREHMKRIEKEIFWSSLEPAVEKKGLKVIAVWENGYRHITNNKRPINVPKDLDGLKLRTPKGKWRVKMFQAYGANPSPLAFSEVHVYTPAYVTVGAKRWASLPADVRSALESAAKETQAFVYKTAAGDEAELLGKIKAAGVQVNNADKNAFIAASKPIYAEFAKEVKGSQALIDRAIALGK